jgi:AcrR family transcriptional regulator
MRKRALEQERTRQRIVEATVELHGSVGPKHTSISAVAELAGVQRLTVYRHFPDEFALFSACSSHWMSQNPPPNSAAWQHVADPTARMQAALLALYVYYRRTASMLTLVFRDAAEVEALRGPVQAFQGHMNGICEELVASWHPKQRRSQLLTTAIAHAMAFSTWSSLSGLGLTDAQSARLVSGWISATAG